MRVRDAAASDWEQIWPFFRQITTAGETYAYDRDLDKADAGQMWMVREPGRVTVAVDDDGAVIGSASMYRNRRGPGAHVASASFMVDPNQSGRGAGRALAEDMIGWARSDGFRAIQFNAVVETNAAAGPFLRRSTIQCTDTWACT
jgi:L-amino acid N-acyltransferase YncA